MSFDPLARHYHWMERVLAGEKLQRCRTRWLSEVADCREVLLVGEGHGRFLVACVEALPNAKIMYVDASERMLEVARRQIQKPESITFVHASLPHADLPVDRFDLIVTNFFFDCFGATQLRSIIDYLSTLAAPGARWLVSEFHEPSRGWKRVRARAVLGLAYTFFRFATRLPARRLPDYAPLLEERGFLREKRAFFDWGLLVAELWRAR